jgi:hypothetical protein
MKRRAWLLFVPVAAIAGAGLLQACSGDSQTGEDLFDAGTNNPDGTVTPDGSTTSDGSTNNDGSTKNDGSTNNDGSTSDGSTNDGAVGDGGTDARPCQGLECQQVTCDGGGTTTITGKVLDPAGINPVYNALVYVPNATVPALSSGVSCQACGSAPPGEPVVLTLTAGDGSFTLSNVPAGTNVPVVIQIGKWRRQVQIPTVAPCTNNQPAQNLLRLPKNSTEGNIPKMALVTGGCDHMECALRKMGVEDSEFTSSAGNGRIHLYQGTGGAAPANGTENATALWSDYNKLAQYDLVLNNCECDSYATSKPAPSLRNLYDYANAGGRVLGSHYQVYWLKNGPFPFPANISARPPRRSRSTRATPRAAHTPTGCRLPAPPPRAASSPSTRCAGT